MVPADSQQIPRARCYSGIIITPHTHAFMYRALTVYGRRFHTTSTNTRNKGRQVRQNPQQQQPHNPTACNPCRVSHTPWFSQKSAFARHYSRNHNCFLLLRVLRCFTSPRNPHTAYTRSAAGNHQQRWPGFPIRTPSDQRSIDNSPRPNAALHVLHRLKLPRHPPCALTTQHTQMNQKNKANKKRIKITRVHYTVLKHHNTTHNPPHTLFFLHLTLLRPTQQKT